MASAEGVASAVKAPYVSLMQKGNEQKAGSLSSDNVLSDSERSNLFAEWQVKWD